MTTGVPLPARAEGRGAARGRRSAVRVGVPECANTVQCAAAVFTSILAKLQTELSLLAFYWEEHAHQFALIDIN